MLVVQEQKFVPSGCSCVGCGGDVDNKVGEMSRWCGNEGMETRTISHRGSTQNAARTVETLKYSRPVRSKLNTPLVSSNTETHWNAAGGRDGSSTKRIKRVKEKE